MKDLITLVEIIGSLGLFLYGMQILSQGLQKAASGKFRRTMEMMTGNRLLSILTGFLITVVIQSSSATTVMVVSFVNAGLMNLVSAIGVIIGANIGTTVTGWIVALLGFSMDITVLSLLSMAVALPLMFSKKTKMRDLSEIFLGFGLLFIGLEFIQASMPDISGKSEVLAFLSSFEDKGVWSILLCVLIGTLVTIVVQSSSATMAITLTMAYQGWIGVWTAVALCLGQNIGTTVTAYLASLGTSTSAKRAALGHILFNVIGTVLVLLLLKPMMSVVNAVVPGDVFSLDKSEVVKILPTYLAAFHTFFNLFNAIVFFPFIKPFASLIERIVPEKRKFSDDDYHFTYIADKRTEATEFYLMALEGEVRKMGELTEDMFSSWCSLSSSNDSDAVEEKVRELSRMEERGDQMQEQLTDFAVDMLKDSQTPTNASYLHAIIRIIDEMESITDSIYNLSKLSEDRIRKGIVLHSEERAEIEGYKSLTGNYLSFVMSNISNDSPSMLEEAKDKESRMDSEHKRLGDEVQKRLSEGNGDFRTQLLILEIERNLEHIGDYLTNIAETVCHEEKHTPGLEEVWNGKIMADAE